MLTVFFSERRCKITNIKSFLLESIKNDENAFYVSEALWQKQWLYRTLFTA